LTGLLKNHARLKEQRGKKWGVDGGETADKKGKKVEKRAW